jgi:hypothetical protein
VNARVRRGVGGKNETGGTEARLRAACLVTRPLGETIFRSGGFCERGLEYYAQRLYGPSNFFSAIHHKLTVILNFIITYHLPTTIIS